MTPGRRVLALLLIAFVAASCGGGDSDDGSEDEATQTTERSTTTQRATTTRLTNTTERPAASTTTTQSLDGAGLLTPPTGYTEAQVDAYAASVISALTDAGWSQVNLEASIDLMQGFVGIAASQCDLFDTASEVDAASGGGTAAVDGFVSTFVSDIGEFQEYFAASLVSGGGLPTGEANQLADDFVQANIAAAREHLCPPHAQLMDQMLTRLAAIQ